jgi:hypothetical protein
VDIHDVPNRKARVGTLGNAGVYRSALKLGGKNSFEHYADWFYGKTTGAASMHIDPSMPNGNGTLQGGDYRGCAKFTMPSTAPDFVPML